MPRIQDVCRFLESFAPLELAEEWDNVGLLAGDREATVERIMTCLTVTPGSVREAVARGAQLVVSHHPLPFRPLKRLTTDETPGRLLWQLARAGIAIYSPHTAFDSAAEGINRQLAERIGLVNIRPLRPAVTDDSLVGGGRCGDLTPAMTLSELGRRVCDRLRIAGVQRVGAAESDVLRVAVACGSAGSYLAAAHSAGCQVLVTGETSFHTCLEAESLGLGLILPGHYATERLGVERLAEILKVEFASLDVWASEREADPLIWQGV